MLIRAWRLQNKLTLAQAKGILGFQSVSYLHELERGEAFVSGAAALRIFYITRAIGPEAVTVEDLLTAWRRANRAQDNFLRSESRSVAREFLAARQQEQTKDGRKTKRQRQKTSRAPA